MKRSEITAQIGQNLRRARKKKHLTQQDIADRTGISACAEIDERKQSDARSLSFPR